MNKQNVYIGNCSKKGIYHCNFEDGKLFLKNTTNDFTRCTYLANTNNYLYGVLEVQDIENKNNGYIISYNKSKDSLINIDKKSAEGQGPCHIEINEEKQLIFISNYVDGAFTVFKINDGYIGEKLYSNIQNYNISHVHCAKTTSDNNFLFMVDLGDDAIIVYELKENSVKEVYKLVLEKNTEPRHIVVIRDKIYLITERTCQLYVIKFINKKLEILNKVSILPNNIEIQDSYTGCAIKASKDFKYLYVTIRGHNSIGVYKIKGNTVEFVQNISCGGFLPRDLEVDKYNKYILVANQDSDEIAIFKRNELTGKLTYKCKEEIDSPTCVIME